MSVKLINYLLIIDQQMVAFMNFLLMADSPFSRHFFLNLNVYKKTNSTVKLFLFRIVCNVCRPFTCTYMYILYKLPSTVEANSLLYIQLYIVRPIVGHNFR